MIRALRDRAGRGVSFVVLMRDAVRLARRWQTYATRAAFSAALLSLVLVAIWAITSFAQEWHDAAGAGTAGRWLFHAFAVVQVLVASLVAPFTVASAVVEEREQGTIELLLITRLDARRILRAKILARLLVLLTVVLGGLPVMALVVTLGGVSVIEVVAVTVHALVATVVLGVLAGFFAVFTRFPAVATVASLVYGFLAFLFAPVVYTSLTGDVRGLAALSPLYGTSAENAFALLPALSYAPVVALALALGARFYELKVSRARLVTFFRPAYWSFPALKWTGIAVGVGLFTVLPFAVGGAWVWSIAQISTKGQPTTPGTVGTAIEIVGGLSRFTVWAWCVGLLVLGTWLYLRLAADMVMLTDDLVDPRGRRTEGPRRPVHVWSNPVAWRSLRAAHWRTVVPALGGWALVLIGVFQLGWWIVPGGLLAVGAMNTAAALVLVAWLGASGIEVERRTGSIEILLTTTMNAFSIVLGKLLGVLAPSAPLMALSTALLVVGAPHLEVLFLERGDGFVAALALGAAAAAWALALWVLVAVGSMALALGLPNPRNAYPIAVVSTGLLLVAPPSIVVFAEGAPALQQALRLVVPVLVLRPTLWEIGSSLVALLAASGVLFFLCCAKLRTWGLRHA